MSSEIDMKCAQIRPKILTMICAIFVIIVCAIITSSIGSGADSDIILSKHDANLTNYCGVDYINWSAEILYVGQFYDCVLEVSSKENLDYFEIHVSIDGDHTAGEMISIDYWHKNEWRNVDMVVVEDGIIGVASISDSSVTPDTPAIIPIRIQYNSPGYFVIDMWIEGE